MVKTFLLGLAAVLVCTGCGQAYKGTEPTPVKPVVDYTAKDVDASLVQASNGFGLALVERILSGSPDKNVLLSPISVSAALALVSTGAAGKTAEEMKRTLGLEKKTNDDIGEGYRILVDLLSHPEEGGFETNVASSLWLKEGKPFKEEFARRSKDGFGAEIIRADFSSPETLRSMNDWVKAATGGKIDEMLEALNPEAAMYALNAVYFRGAWTKPFNPEHTTDGLFHVSDGTLEQTRMMGKDGFFPYVKEQGYESIKLPYGKNGSAYMAVLLPDPGVSLTELAKKLADDPKLLTMEYEVHQGRIEIPQVRLEYSVDLKEAVRQTGMHEAFDPQLADFSAMAPEPPNLFISLIKHRTALSLDEKGTEAAAATAVEMLAGAAPPEQPFKMTVDRPFLTAIVDQATGCILFAGAVYDPTSGR